MVKLISSQDCSLTVNVAGIVVHSSIVLFPTILSVKSIVKLIYLHDRLVVALVFDFSNDRLVSAGFQTRFKYNFFGMSFRMRLKDWWISGNGARVRRRIIYLGKKDFFLFQSATNTGLDIPHRHLFSFLFMPPPDWSNQTNRQIRFQIITMVLRIGRYQSLSNLFS